MVLVAGLAVVMMYSSMVQYTGTITMILCLGGGVVCLMLSPTHDYTDKFCWVYNESPLLVNVAVACVLHFEEAYIGLEKYLTYCNCTVYYGQQS